MNINILTNGTRGDIQPLIYLAEGLVSAGDQVKITAGENFKELITSSGIEYASMPVNLQDYMNSPEGKNMIEKISGNLFSYMKEMKKLMNRFSRETLESYWNSSEDADLLITTTGALGDVIIAQKLSIPLAEVQLQPLYPSKEYSYPLIPIKLPTSLLRKSSYYFMEAILNNLFKKDLSKWQKETFGEVMKYRGGVFAERRRSSDLIIGAFSSALVERPSSWPAKVHLTGFFRPDKKAVTEAELDAEVSEFLSKGEAPVYLGFGSAPVKRNEILFSAIERLLEEGETRIIFSSPWEEQKCPILHERLLCIKTAPHEILFPLTAGVIHHGGAGTLSAALYAGVPQAIYPLNADQPFWSRILYSKRLIPRPVGLKRLSFENLKKSVHYLKAPSNIKKAKEISGDLKNEQGILNAVSLIRKLKYP